MKYLYNTLPRVSLMVFVLCFGTGNVTLASNSVSVNLEIECPSEALVLCEADFQTSIPDSNKLLIGEDNPEATSCGLHLSLNLPVTSDQAQIQCSVGYSPSNTQEFIEIHPFQPIEVDSSGNAVLHLSTSTSADSVIRSQGLAYNTGCMEDDNGYHRLVWRVTDTSGDTIECEQLVRLEDCVAPDLTPVGISSVVVPVSGEVTIWAKDFYASVLDDCSSEEEHLFSFDSASYTPSRTFDCDDFCENGSPQYLLLIVAADGGRDLDCSGTVEWNERNKQNGQTAVFFDDNLFVCGADDCGGLGTGRVTTEEGVGINNVVVSLCDQNGVIATTSTDEQGWYSSDYTPNPLLDLQLKAEKIDEYTNGVSTLDLIKIQKHLLGYESLSSPYKRIAADANNSESISAIDLLELRKLLLGIYSELPNNKAWVFIPENFVFLNVESPWPYDDFIEWGPPFSWDFIGVKIGDVDNSAIPGFQSIENRSSQPTLYLMGNDLQFIRGEIVEVPVKADHFNEMLGFQFTMETGSLEFLDVIPGALQLKEESIAEHENAVTAVWFDVSPHSTSSQATLFTLRFKARESGTLSEQLSISSRITEALAFYSENDQNIAEYSVALNIEPEIKGASFTLDTLVLCNEDDQAFLPETNQLFVGEGDPNAVRCGLHLNLKLEIPASDDSLVYSVGYYPSNGADFYPFQLSRTVAADSAGIVTFDLNTAELGVGGSCERRTSLQFRLQA